MICGVKGLPCLWLSSIAKGLCRRWHRVCLNTTAMRNLKIHTSQAILRCGSAFRFAAAVGWIACGLAAALIDDARGNDNITVTLASGRTFVGQIDSQTDQDILWLRVTHGPIVLLRPIEWGALFGAGRGASR